MLFKRSPLTLALWSGCLAILVCGREHDDGLKHLEHSAATRTSSASQSDSTAIISVGGGDPGIYPGTERGASKGWPFMPDLTELANATLDTTTMKVGDQGAVVTHYVSSNYTASKIKRAVIMVHGDDRVGWNMQIYANDALIRATGGGQVKYEEVVVVAPEFFTNIDVGAFPVSQDSTIPSDGAMVWDDKLDNWGDGSSVLYPQNSTVGAFDALDTMISFFLNQATFPQLNTVVLAGFSMGAQLVQRYSVFRKDAADDSKVRYWVSSPASFVYLNNSRPNPTSSCTGYNDYKYGLEGTLPDYLVSGSGSNQTLDQASLAPRYVSRKMSFLAGTDDDISGDTRCEATVQGKSHLLKMVNWIDYVMPYIAGGSTNNKLPKNTTIDYVEGVDHDAWKMINSDAGVEHLFLDNYEGDGKTAKAPASNGLKSVKPSTQQLKDAGSSASDPKVKNAGSKAHSPCGVFLSSAFLTFLIFMDQIFACVF